ncbi:peroxiredoxin family protein [Galbibacter mesophilus]|uniref:peroxiredoxin family protein n=1 Tax=Galbibacter mesophilus TaxID=379069 RepID=UPI00191DEBD8|nr:redoxin family protein [Galbibacter mesophilus]MCM5664172.1 redoxin family protein [Galbibacter mesophilus]
MAQEQTILRAPELRVTQWIDAQGNKLDTPIKLADYKGRFKVIYGFQHWCPGCHSVGLPSLKKMVEALEGNDNVVFLAIQTVFEGASKNTFYKIVETQKEYGLAIPFGHDDGSQNGESRSSTMTDFQTGGTPWFIFIDKHDNIVFADFHLNTEAAIEFLKKR